MDEVHRDWGRRVRRRREAIGISQDRLAEICDFRQATISRVEAGTQVLSDAKKWTLCGALGMSPAELFPYPAVVPPHPQGDLVEAAS